MRLLWNFVTELGQDGWFMLAICVVLAEFTAVLFRVYARSEQIYSQQESLWLVCGGFLALILALIGTVIIELVLMVFAGKICRVDINGIPTQTVSLVIFTRFAVIGLAALHASSHMDPQAIPLPVIMAVAACYGLFWASLIELLAYIVSLDAFLQVGFRRAITMTALLTSMKTLMASVLLFFSCALT
ncbi:MAG: hypothetical protein KDA80_23960 [Planctomycetaceae bacterium]|nr:hypothetical protein [Planctomycetaceae bacterium]